jgi:glycosyltransferase involved in cell wall biosynthesis
MKVVFLIGSLKVGGTEKTLVNYINALSEDKSIKIYPILYGSGYDLLPELNVPVLDVTQDKILNKFGWGKLNKGLSIIKLRLALIRINPHKMVSFGEVWNNYAVLLSVGLGIGKILADRGDFYYRWTFTHRLLRWATYDLAQKVVIQRQQQLEIYQGFIERDKIRIIKNNFKEDHIFRISKLREVTAKENSIVCISRFIPSKGIDTVIRVFAKFSQNANFRLYIVGSDDLKFKLKYEYEALVETLNLKDCVFFLDPNTPILDLLASSKAFLFGSNSEGMPNVLLEALFSYNHVFAFQDFLELESKNIPTYHICRDETDMVHKLEDVLGNSHFEVLDSLRYNALRQEFNTLEDFTSLITKD